MGKIITFGILGIVGFLVFSMVRMVGEMADQAGRERELAIQATMVNPRTFEDHSLDTAEEIASDGFKSVVAVAVSADASQTAIARVMPDTITGAAMFLFGVVALIVVIKWAFSKGSSSSPAYISNESFTYKNK